ncbi:MAG: sugar transferase [Oceanicoccus sp.]|uniref:sugar transferase n=1 Tax=Oceanicoccus sp. TaxID=2691044 RepID=UPI002621175A|nr:sugar transferase [Oceanicoccus sp.]MCP3908867.1 sugar transferase [Oceanicoccus sp.]
MNTFTVVFIDRLLALIGIVVAFPFIVLITLVGYFDTGSPIFFQQRIGKNQRPFTLVKFRTMRQGTASVATHEVSSRSITRLGAILRKTKLDELPQLFNVLKGEMSLVGPRPCLFNQEELINERQQRGVFRVLPGITGLAQINHIDMSDPSKLAQWDQQMIESFTLKDYFKYLLLTITGSGQGDRVK